MTYLDMLYEKLKRTPDDSDEELAALFEEIKHIRHKIREQLNETVNSNQSSKDQ